MTDCTTHFLILLETGDFCYDRYVIGVKYFFKYSNCCSGIQNVEHAQGTVISHLYEKHRGVEFLASVIQFKAGIG